MEESQLEVESRGVRGLGLDREMASDICATRKHHVILIYDGCHGKRPSRDPALVKQGRQLESVVWRPTAGQMLRPEER